ncbi:ABC transporter ATP-binding protein [Arcanobacterium phocae]|uniref:ABC transporter ATP-binding protein n=1 Tax=Arcanobacterium phocae TaxID=131112 RepID=UPI001C0EE699|nr:ABC transporter ATP-binding protein [Arcanobacterium phocae]
MVNKHSSSVATRPFDVGPQPTSWPRFFEFSAMPRGDRKRVISSSFRENWQLLIVTTTVTLLLFVGSALVPWALGIFLDSGIERGLTASLLPGGLLVCGVILIRAFGALGTPMVLLAWLRGTVTWQRNIVTHVSGRRMSRKSALSAGEIVASATSDAPKIGNLIATSTETFAATVAFILIAVLMMRSNLLLGLVVTIGLPIVVALMTLLIRPLQSRLSANREERGKLTTLAADAVVGLRVIRGVGGEDVYSERYEKQSAHVMETGIKAAFIQAVLGGLTTAVPALFSAVVISLGIWQVYQGQLTYGQLVAFYGYTAYLSVPVSSATRFFQVVADAKVGARRIGRILSTEPTTSNTRTMAQPPVINWDQAALTDLTSGVHIEPGKLTMIVCSHPDVAAQCAQRLARIDDESEIEVSDGSVVVKLSQLPLADVRDGIVLSGATAQLFQGRVRSNINGPYADDLVPRTIAEQMADTGDGSGQATRQHRGHPQAASDQQLHAALTVADANDVVLGLANGLDGYIAERGRSLSGGQRQRLALARAVLHNPPVLIAIEPTSAVDSHTEMRIARALSVQRAGKTTVIVSMSPIMLHQADTVIVLNPDGTEHMRGSHDDLSQDPFYHALVQRTAVDDQEEN